MKLPVDSINTFLTLFLILFTTDLNCYRILSIYPFPFKSNLIFHHALMKNLVKKGHQVDVISYHELSKPLQNYKTILNLSNISHTHPIGKFNSIEQVIERNRDIFKVIKKDYGVNLCNLMSHEKMQMLIKNPPKNPPYDVFITQGTSTNCYFGFGSVLKVPVVSIAPGLEFSQHSRMIGNPLYTSFYPTALYMDSKIQTFWDRIANTLLALNGHYKLISNTENQSESIKKYLNPNISSVSEVEKLVSLFIANTHHSIQGIRPTVPGLIEAGGIHIEEDESSLTSDVKKWMDESTSGVIFFAFGSTVPIESLPKETIVAIFSTFRKVAPIRILIKVTDGFQFPFELPKNVLKMTWVPQISVLKHHNTRLFISHGGVHSIMEAIYFGIPVFGIPTYYDQHQNIKTIVHKGMGLELAHDKITEESFHNTLTTLLNNSKFREAAKYHSKIFRDRPLSAGDEAVYWIEYVIRNGANSLRSSSTEVYWWQTDLLDVYVFLIFIMILAFLILLISVKCLCKLCVRNSKLKSI